MQIKKQIMLGVMMVVATGNHRLEAQEFGLTYTTELQTDFRKGSNWVNLLRSDFSFPITRQMELKAATISVARTREESLADDLQTFSNIEEENIPLALAVCGAEWHTGKSTFFVGIRNLNEDYFASPCTSLFTNSSCGIFPTLSANYPIANYPLASVGIDYKLTLEHWEVETSLYNGTGYRMWVGRENVFRVCPATDGILSVTSINYRKNGSNYYMGFALRSGLPVGDENGNETQASALETQRQLNTVIWTYAEQHLSSRVYALCQYSFNPTEKNGCRSYAGAGLVWHCGKTEGGAFADYADFSSEHEWAAELTWKVPCLKHGYLQPTLHLIRNSHESKVIGLLRLGYFI